MGNNDAVGASAPVKPAFNLTDLDHWILKQTDETFKKHDWQEIQHIIGECAPQPEQALCTPSRDKGTMAQQII